MSKSQAAPTAKERNKSKSNSVNSVAKKSATSSSTLSSIRTATKKPVSETKTKTKPIKTLSDEKVSPDPPKIPNTLKLQTKSSTNTTSKSRIQEMGVQKKRPIETKTSSQIARAKNSSSKLDLSQSSPSNGLNGKASLKPSKPNAVLDTIHNVTVSSPPSKRKIETIAIAENHDSPDVIFESHEKRTRTRTRTLDPDEVIVLRNESAKKRSQAEIEAQEAMIKDPVAFEINFENPSKASAHSREPSRGRSKPEKLIAGNDAEVDANYSDDFESYESDFETGSSSPTVDSTEDDENDDDDDDDDDDEIEENKVQETTKTLIRDIHGDDDDHHDDDEDESELTQFPITVIQREREVERKLDSGNYEMHSSKQGKNSEIPMVLQHHFDSLDTFSGAISEQLDSGISSYGNLVQSANHKNSGQRYCVFYGGYTEFNTRPIISQRGKELMSKIQFDTLSFTFFELKPISYEDYMQTYGKLNATQSSTQTNENRMTTESQTDDYDVRSKWTQHPAQYDLKTVQLLTTIGRSEAQNCCGEFGEENSQMRSANTDEMDNALRNLMAFRQLNENKVQELHSFRKPIDFDRLHSFLRTTTAMVLGVLKSESTEQNLDARLRQRNDEPKGLSQGYHLFNTGFLNALRAIRIFSNPRHDIVITVHESLPEADVYRNDFSNLLMVWSVNEFSKPLRLLSAWSEVSRIEICNETSDIIVCGLRDGSVAMWDLREAHTFCSKLDGYLTHFAATQSIVPMYNSKDSKMKKLIDIGAVVDIKSFRSRSCATEPRTSIGKYKSIQFVSLNDTGILTIWTLVDTVSITHASPQLDVPSKKNQNTRAPSSPYTRFEYSSPWARVKLIQSAICDLRINLESDILKAQSNFDRTKLLFEKNIYSDEVLRDIHEVQSNRMNRKTQIQGIRFTAIDTGCETIYVCTDQNFILICSKTLKAEKLRKIFVNEDRFLFPTALCVLTNEDFLAVGLSNGSVMIMNCNKNKTMPKNIHFNEDNIRKSKTKENKKMADSHDIDLETGKSCAIQNIILNERHSFDNDFGKDFDAIVSRPTTAACISLISTQKKPYELRIFDHQVILSGSMLRKDLVQSLALSSDGWRLFALSDGEIRTYDFYTDREITANITTSEDERTNKIMDICVAKTSHSWQNLIVLTEKYDVQNHILKQ